MVCKVKNRLGECYASSGVLGVYLHRLSVQVCGMLRVSHLVAPEKKVSFQDQVVGLAGSFALLSGRCSSQGGLQCEGNGTSNLVLDLEDIDYLAVVGPRPDVRAVGGAYELCGDAYHVAVLSNATFEHVAHVQRSRDFGNGRRFVFDGN